MLAIGIYQHKIIEAYKKKNIFYLCSLNNRKFFYLLTQKQKNIILELALSLKYDILNQLEIGTLSPVDLDSLSNAIDGGVTYTYYIRRFLLPLFYQNRDLAKRYALMVFDSIAQNPYLNNKKKWNDCFLILLGENYYF